MVAFFKLGVSIYREKVEWKTHKITPELVVTVTFDPEKISSPENLLVDLKNEFADAYSAIYGYSPIILLVPVGFRFQYLEASDFVSCLPGETRKQLKRALYKQNGF